MQCYDVWIFVLQHHHYHHMQYHFCESDAYCFTLDGRNIALSTPVYDKDRQFVNFTLQNELKVGEFYNITLEYEGELDNDLAGLDYSSYDELNTTTNLMEKR